MNSTASVVFAPTSLVPGAIPDEPGAPDCIAMQQTASRGDCLGMARAHSDRGLKWCVGVLQRLPI
jgi:hypothetical protein